MRKLLDAFCRLLTWFCVVGFTLMLLITWYQIVARHTPVWLAPWTEEAARLLFVFTVLFGITVAIHHREHIVVDFISAKMPARMQRVMNILYDLGSLLFLAAAFSGALNLSKRLWMASLATIEGVTKGQLYALEAIAIGLMFIYVLANVFLPEVKAKEIDYSEELSQ